jgi:hypothetical protein
MAAPDFAAVYALTGGVLLLLHFRQRAQGL